MLNDAQALRTVRYVNPFLSAHCAPGYMALCVLCLGLVRALGRRSGVTLCQVGLTGTRSGTPMHQWLQCVGVCMILSSRSRRIERVLVCKSQFMRVHA